MRLLFIALQTWSQGGGDRRPRGIHEHRQQWPESAREAVDTVGAMMMRRSTAGMVLLACGLTVCSVVAGASVLAVSNQGRIRGLRNRGDRAWGSGIGRLGRAPHRFAPLGRCLHRACVLGSPRAVGACLQHAPHTTARPPSHAHPHGPWSSACTGNRPCGCTAGRQTRPSRWPARDRAWGIRNLQVLRVSKFTLSLLSPSLSVCLHTCLVAGGRSVLGSIVPQAHGSSDVLCRAQDGASSP